MLLALLGAQLRQCWAICLVQLMTSFCGRLRTRSTAARKFLSCVSLPGEPSSAADSRVNTFGSLGVNCVAGGGFGSVHSGPPWASARSVSIPIARTTGPTTNVWCRNARRLRLMRHLPRKVDRDDYSFGLDALSTLLDRSARTAYSRLTKRGSSVSG